MGINLEKCSITSLAHQWIICCEWVPSEWGSKQLIKKHHNNPHHSSPSCEVYKAACLYKINPSRHFKCKQSLLSKIWVHNQFKASSCENVLLLLSSYIKNICLELFLTVFICKQYSICAWFSHYLDEMTFFSLEKATLWINNSFETLNDGFVS